MRKNTTSAAALDAFLRGDRTALVEPAQRGLRVFLASKCHDCHGGPMLTDEKLHKVGFPSRPGAAPDRGGADAQAMLSANIFNLAGPYADPGPGVPATVTLPSAEEGSFRTPSLRNVARTFPYGHDGALESLGDVLDVHARGLSQDERADLLAFFETLNGEYPLPPWNDWPTRQ
jgi:cytochrome c peroxidase